MTLYRLDYLTEAGWEHGHAGIALVDPQRYVDRLTSRVARASTLDERLQPTGETFCTPCAECLI